MAPLVVAASLASLQSQLLHCSRYQNLGLWSSARATAARASMWGPWCCYCSFSAGSWAELRIEWMGT